MNFVFQDGNAHGGNDARCGRKLSEIGAALYAAAITLLCVLGALCLRTDFETAVWSMLCIVLLPCAAYLCTALLTHGRLMLTLLSAAGSFLLSLIITGDAVRSLTVLVFYVPAVAVWFYCSRYGVTFTGGIVAGGAGVGAALLIILCVLVRVKYGEVSLSSFIRAYESLCEVILSSPRATLALLEAESAVGMEAFIDSYRTLLLTLDEMLGIMLYSIPSIFMSVCAIGGFACVFSYKRHVRMQAQEDRVGRFEMSAVSAVLYIILNLLVLFIDPITPLGIAVITVCSPIELGLALLGGVWGYYWIKKNNKSQAYYVIPILLAVILPSVCITLLAYFGAYRTVFLWRLRRLAEKGSDDSDTRR